MKVHIQLEKLPRVVSLDPTLTSDGEVRPESEDEEGHVFTRIGAVVINVTGMLSMKLLPFGSETPAIGVELYNDNTMEIRGLPEDLVGWVLLAEYGADRSKTAVAMEISPIKKDEGFGLN